MSLHSELMVAGSELLVEVLAARTPEGEFAKVLYRSPQGVDSTLSGVIVANLSARGRGSDDQGTHAREENEEILELTIPLAQGAEMFSPQLEARLTVAEYGSPPFTLQEVTSLTETWANVQCRRTAITRLRRKQHERRG